MRETTRGCRQTSISAQNAQLEREVAKDGKCARSAPIARFSTGSALSTAIACVELVGIDLASGQHEQRNRRGE